MENEKRVFKFATILILKFQDKFKVGNLLYVDNYKEPIEDYNKLILAEIKFYQDKIEIDLLNTFVM